MNFLGWIFLALFFIVLFGIPIVNAFIVIKYYRGVFPRILSYVFFVLLYGFVTTYLTIFPSLLIVDYFRGIFNVYIYHEYLLVCIVMIFGFLWSIICYVIFRSFLKKKGFWIIFFQSSLYVALAICAYVAKLTSV